LLWGTVLASLLALFFLFMGLAYAIGGNLQAAQEISVLTVVGVVMIFTTWIVGIILSWRREGKGGGLRETGAGLFAGRRTRFTTKI